MATKDPELYIGIMSGTSIDAIDIAITAIDENKIQLVGTTEFEISNKIKQAVSELSQPLIQKPQHNSQRIEKMARLDIQLGQLFAAAVNHSLLDNNLKANDIVAIGSHGQTIRHRPNQAYPFSCQLGDANSIAELTHITTVADFRRADMAAGGQGAPLAPAFHNALLRSAKDNRIILNLGGIANITYLAKDPRQPVIGFDTGPANTLMDAWYVKHHAEAPQGYDKDGKFANQGQANENLLQGLLNDPYFAQDYPKSSGREYFSLDWLENIIKQTSYRVSDRISASDIQATLLELTANSIIEAIARLETAHYQIFCCGGGAHNPPLMQAIKLKTSAQVTTTNQLGVDGDYLEAMCFAWLAYRRVNRLPSNLPSVTGASKEKCLGAIYLP